MPATSADPTILDYLRHGTPVGGSRFRGHGVDDALSDTGWQQMRETTAAVGNWQHIVSSPMQRCRAFAEWLGEEHDLPVEVVTDLREVGFGTWEGRQRDELKRDRGDEYRAFYADPVNNRPSGAEPLDQFGARVAAVFDRLVERFGGQHLLVVCHAGVIRGTLGHVTQAPAVNWYRTEIDNAAITRFAHDHRGPRLVAHNWRPRL
jgi:broad specificity phosphatase PhoE